jgi:hypothetical protein
MFLISECGSAQGSFVRRSFPRRLLARRIVALATAYALALSGLIGGFATARAAAAAPAGPGVITCHTDSASGLPPAGESGGKPCVDDCCIGCLMLLAALPPPPDIAAGRLHSSAQKLALPTGTGFARTQRTRSHQSRGPPQSA